MAQQQGTGTVRRTRAHTAAEHRTALGWTTGQFDRVVAAELILRST